MNDGPPLYPDPVNTSLLSHRRGSCICLPVGDTVVEVEDPLACSWTSESLGSIKEPFLKFIV